MDKAIRLQHVSFHYPNRQNILSDINLTIESGSFLGITGVNGSGKSTLTYLMNGLIPHAIPGTLEGMVLVAGTSTRKKNVAFFSHQVGMVFQNPDFSLFNLTVNEEIGFGLKNLNGYINQNQIKKALKQVGLEGYESRDPQTLSFGEKQKVCLAGILALNVSYIVLDEPTAMLDYKSSVELYQLLKYLNEKRGITIILVEHDTDFLWEYAKKLVIINRGKIKSLGKTKNVLKNHYLLTSLGIKKPREIQK